MCSLQQAQDPAFSTISTRTKAATVDSRQNPIAMHGIANSCPGDEDVPLDPGDGLLSDHEGISVRMRDHAACKEITSRETRFALGFRPVHMAFTAAAAACSRQPGGFQS
jgi:hypothetical protein